MTTSQESDSLPALTVSSRIVIGAGLLCGLALTALLLLLAIHLPAPAKFAALAVFALNWIALTRFIGKAGRPWLKAAQYSALRLNWVLGVSVALIALIVLVKTTPQRPLQVAALGLMCLLWGAAGRRLSRR